jgi:hypothetical protein
LRPCESYSWFSTRAITNSTISGNQDAENRGGGIYGISDTLTNTIVAGNGGSDVVGVIYANFSLIGNTAGAAISGSNNALNVSADLAPLGDYGGPTQTMALLPGSPAINAGDPNFAAPPVTDQRGQPRVIDGRIDIGAFEFTNVTSTSVSASATSSTYGDMAIITATITAGATPMTAGTVTFTDGTKILDIVNVNSLGQASFDTSTLSAGVHSILASYSGTRDYTASSGSEVETVQPAPLIVTANDITHVYGTAYGSFTVTYSGFVNGEDASLLGGGLAFVLSVSSHVGTYPNSIVPLGLTSINYHITFARGTVTTTPATLTYMATAKTRNYGSANPTLGGTVTGFKLGDNLPRPRPASSPSPRSPPHLPTLVPMRLWAPD